LSGQIGAGPMSDVQPLGYRLQARQLDDSCSLEGGKAVGVCPCGAGRPTVVRNRYARTVGKVARPLRGRNAGRMRRSVCVRPSRLPRPRGHAEPEGRAGTGCGKHTRASEHLPEQELADKAFDRAWEILRERIESIYYYSPANFLQDFVAGTLVWPFARPLRQAPE
jgi:hypothetical protein